MVRSSRSRWLFAWLFVVNAVLTLSYTLVGQWATIGFDPVFYHPILIAVAALVFMVCVALFLVLSAVGVGVAVVSFGKDLDLNDVLFPLGLSMLLVFAFFLVRVRPALPSTMSEGHGPDGSSG